MHCPLHSLKELKFFLLGKRKEFLSFIVADCWASIKNGINLKLVEEWRIKVQNEWNKKKRKMKIELIILLALTVLVNSSLARKSRDEKSRKEKQKRWNNSFFSLQIEASYDDGPCGQWRPGDADLGTWDMLNSFHLDSYESHFEIISQIEGSNSLQTAYRLERESNLTMRAEEAFPRGTPFEFSFECTYRERQKQQDSWHLFHLTNSHEESQLSVTLNPAKETLQVSLPDARGDLQSVEFRHSGVSYFPCYSLIYCLMKMDASEQTRKYQTFFFIAQKKTNLSV